MGIGPLGLVNFTKVSKRIDGSLFGTGSLRNDIEGTKNENENENENSFRPNKSAKRTV